LLTYFTSGIFHGQQVYRKAQSAFADGEIFGTGFIKVFDDDGEVGIERVLTNEILVDDVEGIYGEPRNLYQHKEVERAHLFGMWPKFKDEIKEAGLIREGSSYSSAIADPVSLLEAWHLPDGNNPGKHIISVSGKVLFEEPWKSKKFPFATFRWIDRPMGFWGKGVPEQLRGIQIEVNVILQKIQRHMQLASSKVFVEKGSKVNKSKLNNEEFGVVEYAGGKPPVFATIESISPEYFRQIEALYQKAFEISGISQLAAQSRKPGGLDSGKALREYNDIQTQRFLHVGQRWEQFFLDIADLVVECARQINKDHGGYKVLADIDNELEELDWKDVDPGRDKFIMKAWPVSLLPDSPPGKLQAVQELLNVDPRLQPYATSLLDYPDLEAVTRRINAPVLIMDKILNQILEYGKYIAPVPQMDLNLGVAHMQSAYLDAKITGVEANKLEMILDWVNDAQDIMTRAQDEITQKQMNMQAQAEAQAQQEMLAQQAQGGMGAPMPAGPQMPGAIPTPIQGAIPGKI
jgi:hypothetical protein